MDEKEKLILQHYRNKIENRLFDEYDILGFLIFIRRHISGFPCVLEFSNLIAHRERDRGIAMECISVIQDNDYMLEKGSNRVSGYNGISFESLSEELKRIGTCLEIVLNDLIVREICLCMFSLAQYTTYRDKDAKGKITLNQGANGILALSTTEGNFDSIYVTFSTLPGIKHVYEYSAGIISIPVHTARENGILELIGDGKVISIVEEYY